jgi:hypothetical protein
MVNPGSRGVAGQFLWALVCDWQGALSTTGSVVLMLLGLMFRDTPVPRWATLGVATLCFLYASGRAWVRENKARLDAERKLYDGRPIFVLEVAGSQPLDGNSDWRFFLTNCGNRIARYVKLGLIKSEIGAYVISFKEVPVIKAGEKVAVEYEVISRRSDDRHKDRRPSLWDFALDNAGERGSTYLWYDMPVGYKDVDDSFFDGGVMSICFDLKAKKLKTEDAEYYRQHSYPETLRRRELL